MTSAISAAVEVGRRHGVNAADPKVVQETNNTVVWLRPEPVIAKVATRTEARGDLRLEHAVAVELAAVGADIAVPLPEASPSAHNETGFVVTLWRRIEGARGVALSADELAASLRRLHGALRETKTKLPSFPAALVRAREALHNDGFTAALAPSDRTFLRVTIDDGLGLLDGLTFEERRLHGEPHDANRLVTATGLRWIDFESCCTGPVEWDLAFQPPEVIEHFPDIDPELLILLRRLNSARVATWCWGRARFPEMRRHAEMHLASLHRQTDAC